MEVQFEEDTQLPQKKRIKENKSLMTQKLVEFGVVKNKQQANYILLILIAVLAIIFCINIFFLTKQETNTYDPALDIASPNAEKYR
jgi:hypothetical protein